MNEQTNVVNLFSEWCEAVEDVWFTTRSPYPDKEYYFSANPIPYCRNSPMDLKPDSNYESVFNYFKEQSAILLYNNPGFSGSQLAISIKNRILYWRGNQHLKGNFELYNLNSHLEQAIIQVFNSTKIEEIVTFGEKYHWYSDRIERLPGHKRGGSWSEKTRAKLKARTNHTALAVREDIRSACEDFKADYLNILPTLPDLMQSTGYSEYKISRYGKEFFISKEANTMQLIEKTEEFCPDLTNEEMAEYLDMGLRTITRHRPKFRHCECRTQQL